jgi:hypothetical protein
MKNQLNKQFIRSYRKSAKSDLKLSQDQIDTSIGLMMGDLHAEKRNSNCNTRLQFKQSIINKDYIDHLYELFKDCCGSKPKVTNSLEKRANRNPINSSIKF